MAGHGVNRAKTEGTGDPAAGVTRQAIRRITFDGIRVLSNNPVLYCWA